MEVVFTCMTEGLCGGSFYLYDRGSVWRQCLPV